MTTCLIKPSIRRNVDRTRATISRREGRDIRENARAPPTRLLIVPAIFLPVVRTLPSSILLGTERAETAILLVERTLHTMTLRAERVPRLDQRDETVNSRMCTEQRDVMTTVPISATGRVIISVPVSVEGLLSPLGEGPGTNHLLTWGGEAVTLRGTDCMSKEPVTITEKTCMK